MRPVFIYVPHPEARITSNRTAHSLVELLVVVGIIGILLSLIAPAASRVYGKAQAMKWENEGYPWKLQQQLRPFYSQLEQYPKFSADELFENQIIEQKSRQFLRSPFVDFQPFSSKDDDQLVVIRFGWSKEFQHHVTKASLTKAPED